MLAGCVAPEASQPGSEVDAFPLGLHPSGASSSSYRDTSAVGIRSPMTSFHLVPSLKVLAPNAVTSRAEASTHVYREMIQFAVGNSATVTMTNLGGILKSRDITLLTNVYIVKVIT